MRDLTFETCDRCGPSVSAKVLIQNIPVVTTDVDTGVRSFSFGGELTLCGHDYDMYALQLINAKYAIDDYRVHRTAQPAA